MKFSGTKKIVAVFGGLFILGLAANIIFFLTIKGTIEKDRAAEQVVSNQNSAAEQVGELKTLMTSVQPEIDSLSTRVVSQNGAVDFINLLESTARSESLDITVQSVDTSDTNAPQPNLYQFLALSLQTTGSWQNTYTFLSLLEDLPYKSDINSVSLTETGSSSWSADISLQVLQQKTAQQ